MENIYIIHDGELSHTGVKGMRWGVRRYQNADGTLTDLGRKRYAKEEYKSTVNEAKRKYKAEVGKNKTDRKAAKINGETQLSELEQYKRSQRTKGIVKGIIGGAGVVTAAYVAAPAIMLSWGLVNAVREK